MNESTAAANDPAAFDYVCVKSKMPVIKAWARFSRGCFTQMEKECGRERKGEKGGREGERERGREGEGRGKKKGREKEREREDREIERDREGNEQRYEGGRRH